MADILDLNTIPAKGNENITLTGGCFDILHPGHLKFLQKAKELGGKVYVLLESDESIKQIKGDNRPVNNQSARALALSKLEFVDFVICIPQFKNDSDYFSLVKRLKPDIIAVTRGDPLIKKKSEQAKVVGGKVVEVTNRIKKYSTTKILKNERNRKQ